jgi:hypothetical protein
MADTTVDSLPPSEPPQPSKGAFERVIGVFFEPTATFADIARSPSFLAPLLLLIIFSCATSAVMVQRIDAEQMVRQQIMKSSRAADIPKEQLDKQVEMGAKFAKYSFYFVPIFLPIWLLILAGVLFIMSNFIFGGTSTYKQLFAVAAHAQMPGIILGILSIVVLFLKDPADIDVQNMVATNLGPLISDETSKIGHRLAMSIDLFSFWQMFLLGKGISASGRMSFAKGLMAVVIPWALYVLVVTGLAALR